MEPDGELFQHLKVRQVLAELSLAEDCHSNELFILHLLQASLGHNIGVLVLGLARLTGLVRNVFSLLQGVLLNILEVLFNDLSYNFRSSLDRIEDGLTAPQLLMETALAKEDLSVGVIMVLPLLLVLVQDNVHDFSVAAPDLLLEVLRIQLSEVDEVLA